MQIDIISVGVLKEKYLVDASKEYLKRLSKFCVVNDINIKDQSNKLSKVEVLKKEKDVLETKIKSNSFVIVLAIEGKQFDSIDFSDYLEKVKVNGYSHMTFVIGGSYGVHQDIKDRADLLLSFSKFTFPHQLFKVILLEQIYRSFKIANNESYHK